MTEIENIRRYIERTNMEKNDAYQMDTREMLDLVHATAETPVEIICLAFEYGKAKGYRAAKAKRRAAK